MYKKFTPLGDRVLVKKPSATKSVGGIFLPESAHIKHKWGTVVALGPGKLIGGTLHPLNLKISDRVLVGDSWGGKDIQINGEEHVIVKEDEILGVIELDEKKS